LGVPDMKLKHKLNLSFDYLNRKLLSEEIQPSIFQASVKDINKVVIYIKLDL
jgi:hypothetical protein